MGRANTPKSGEMSTTKLPTTSANDAMGTSYTKRMVVQSTTFFSLPIYQCRGPLT